jgi:hypothetical protein
MEGEIMSKTISSKMCRLWEMVKADDEYKSMNREFLRLEENFSEIVASLPENQQEGMWAFACMSGEMNWRIMEIVCENMMFIASQDRVFGKI